MPEKCIWLVCNNFEVRYFFGAITSRRVVEKNGYDSLFFFYFVQCLNFVTNATFWNSGHLRSSAKEAHNVMDSIDQAILRHLLKYVLEN
jgi:hypothetical protein